MKQNSHSDSIDKIKKQWESSRIEYKCCRTHLSKDAWETVFSFANEGGGLILLGYRKDGDTYVPEGVENPSQIIDDFTSTVAQKFNFCPVVKAEIIEDSGNSVIMIEVKEALAYQKPIYILDSGPFKGGYKRVGATDIRLNDEDIARYYRERMGAPDSQPTEDMTLVDIDERALSAFKNLRKLERPDAPELALDDRGLLKAYHLLYKDTGKLTIGGLLLFGKEDAIRRYFPALRLDIIRIKGTRWGKDRDPFLSRDLTGNLVHLRITALEIIDQFFLIPFHADERGDRTDENAHRRALREALTNLIMHQNYYHRSPAQVRLYNDRIEFYNPGHSLKDPAFFGIPGSELRNPSIASVFYNIGWAEAKGTGLLSTIEALKKEGYPIPQLLNDTPHDTFTLILPHPFTPQDTPQVTPQDTPQVTPQDTPQVTPQDTQQVELMDKIAKILFYCKIPRSLKEIMSFLVVRDRKHFLETVLHPLLTGEYLVRTLPDRPTSKYQKYMTKNQYPGADYE
ncbi:MAG: ATP-binding protein [Vulcanimicrobiota bacterium]